MSPINTTPPTPADYERTIAQDRAYIEQLEARVRDAENEADKFRTLWDRHGKNDLIAERDALVERVQQAEEALLDVPCEHQREGYLRMQAERDEARAKLDKVRALAVQWSEEAGDYVPPLPPDEPYNLMVNHSRGVLAILDGKTGN